MRMAVLAGEATAAAGASMPWLQPLIVLGSLLLGSGGVVAWRRLTHDKRVGVAQQETAEDAALSSRWQAIIEAQTRSLLDPMVKRIGTLESKVAELETELESTRKKYWSAITYIRTLLVWLNRHLPPDFEHTNVPQPPAILVEDI